MIPGATYIFECPNCGKPIQRGSMMSGNTFGASIYSDGKTMAPMLPDFPEITKCPDCKTIFWLSILEAKERIKTMDFSNPMLQKAPRANFLTLNEYFEALENGIAKNRNEELYIRKQICRLFNDPLRQNKWFRKPESKDIRREENLKKLLELLDVSYINDRIMAAEIKRNLGEFDECIELINGIDDERFNCLKEQFIKACTKKIRRVMLLKHL